MSSIIAALEEDQTGICFRDNRWIETWPLNKDTVLDYFALSSFYDRSCNNEQFKMQRLNMNPTQMLQMRGIEYALHSMQEPHLYVIRKQRRESPTHVTPIASYYVINGTIYQSPTAYAVLTSRMTKALFFIDKAFKQASSYVNFDLYTNYTWSFDKERQAAIAKTTKKEEVKPKEDKMVDGLLNVIEKQFPLSLPTPPTTAASTTTPQLTTPTPALNTATPPTPTGTTAGKRKIEQASTIVDKKPKTS